MNLPLWVLLPLWAVGTVFLFVGVGYSIKTPPKVDGEDLDERLGNLAERSLTSVSLQSVGAICYSMTTSADQWYMRIFWALLITINVGTSLWRKRNALRSAFDSMRIHEEWVAVTNRIFVDVYGGMAVVPRAILAARPF